MNHPIHLHRTDENIDEIEALAARYGGTVGLDAVLSNLNRRATRVPVPGRLVDSGFTWNDSDLNSLRWWPQGITTSADAFDTEDLDGRRLLVTSWYSKDLDGESHGSRITVIDLATLEYRHVLLVSPEQGYGDLKLKPLHVHAGGLAWFGPYLHIAATRRGLFTARFDDIIEVSPTDESFGYRYVLPVRFAYESTVDTNTEQMRYSFLSLDRSTDPPEVVAGEYGQRGMTARIARYPLDPATFHLRTEESGRSLPAALDDVGLGHMQGAAVVGGRYYVTTSRGKYLLGAVRVGTPGNFVTVPRAIPVGPEDIAYWTSEQRFWCQTEYPGKRYVFSMLRPDLDAAADAKRKA